MDNIFEQATRKKLRFGVNGQIGVEQLWDVKEPLLASYGDQLEEEVESYGKSTRRKRVRRTDEQMDNELRLKIVDYILEVRSKEAEEAANAALAKEKEQKILTLIAQKKDEELAGKSVEELEAMLSK